MKSLSLFPTYVVTWTADKREFCMPVGALKGHLSQSGYLKTLEKI